MKDKFLGGDVIWSINTIYQQLDAGQSLRGLVVPPLQNLIAVYITSPPPPPIQLSWAGRRTGPAL